MYWKIVTAIGLSTALLGCSSEAPTIASMRKVPPPSEQLEQLASTISGATYLKNYCNRSDLGENKDIFNAVVSLAQRKGWDMAHLDQSQLSERREVFYGNLVSNRDITENCNQLNRALAGILHSVYPR
ncbi:general secretion pathway protein (plasmid) [Pantoea stewartii subsp. stewartii DC283]|uniref:General secretion pathway protein n=3 Tax=Pantoea stewartii TaxID=66269 RepID=A0ABM6KBY0_PANSE|nr:type II secretion system pilot lipoprotein GspS [Pantoea stewartii]ARF52271.1 general secretion pathway protein [Pantoea stewartii subsp. stewartii DC283]KAB0556807.1 general secretion pathway protein [Pantoea stewartii subsp. stewartii]